MAVDLQAIEKHAEVERVFPVVAFDMLVRCQVLERDYAVVNRQEQHRNKQHEAIHQEENQQRLLADCNEPLKDAIVLTGKLNGMLIKDAKDRIDAQHEENRGAIDQADEVPIVVQAYAGSQPCAVVVETQHAVVTEGAVLRSRWPQDQTSVAELLFDRDSADAQEPSSRTAARVDLQLLRYLAVAWNDPRIHEGC
mmetsp:Transcript_8782/g.16705  ORF Transcript_8782/g.16705 Transcript_8782/m.16705 type:complete len:195 (+) Transcript_8782:182-766(+)